MSAGKCVSPEVEQFSGFVEDQDIVVDVITEHDESPLAVLNHFVAIEKGIGRNADLRPLPVDLVGITSVTDDGLLGLLLFLENGKGKRWRHQRRHRRGGCIAYEIPPGNHIGTV